MNDQKKTKFIENLQVAPYLKDEAVNFIFNNLRNIGLSALPLAVAKVYLKNPQGDSAIFVWTTAIVLSIVALILIVLNIAHGWRRLSELNLSWRVLVPVALIYGFGMAVAFAILMGQQP